MATKGYWREISAVLAFKAVGIATLYFLFVASTPSQSVTPAGMASHLASAGEARSTVAP